MNAPRILTSAAAHAAGYEITYLPSGRLRVVGPDGERYGRTHRRADLVIEFPGKRLAPLRLRELRLPAELRRAARRERVEEKNAAALEHLATFNRALDANLDLFGGAR